MHISKTCGMGYFEQPLSSYDHFNDCRPYFKFLKITNMSGRARHIGNEKMRYLKPRMQKEFKELITHVVIEPENVAVYDDGSPLHTFASKVQKLVRELKKFSDSTGRKDHPNLNSLQSSSLIRDLVKLILKTESSQMVKVQSQYALQSLATIEESLDVLNHQITSFLNAPNQEDKEKLKNILKRYFPKPLELTFSMKPHLLSQNVPAYSALVPLIEEVSPQNLCKLHEDFWHIEELLLGAELTETCQIYAQNLQEIANLEEFQLKLVPYISWLRDPMLILNNKEILVPSRLNVGAIDLFSGKKPPFQVLINQLTSDQNASIMGAIESQKLFSAHIQGVKESPFYFEGGNLLAAINQQGKKIYLCGAFNILYSLLNAQHLLNSAEKKKMVFKELDQVENHFSPDMLILAQERLEKAGLLSRFTTKQEQLDVTRIVLATAKTIEKTMQTTLGDPVCVIGDIFTTQPEFHLDMFLLPAPEGIIFIQDDELCCKVLEMVSERYQLKPLEKKRLAIYQKNAEQRLQKNGEVLKGISETLSKLGFRVVPLPGLYHEQPGLAIVNFMNAIIGKGKNGKFGMVQK
ncbi:MAG: hypothetical protein H0T62_14015 [Parachlamydiaceae bacterium]|nr:hypothetical protein [Parachlamydiaceae bacterium]